MPPLQLVVTVLCVVSGVSGLSVVVCSGWAISVKLQSFSQLYPDAEELVQMKNASLQTRAVWEQLKIHWDGSLVKNISLIGLCLAMGLIQFLVAIFILYGWERADERVLSSKFVICNVVTFLVVLGCLIATTSMDHLTIVKIPFELRQAMHLSVFSVMAFLEFGINSFSLWIGFDLIYLLVNNVIISCFLRRSIAKELVIVIT